MSKAELIAPNACLVPLETDVLTMLLADKRSENTRRAYQHDLRDFFRTIYGGEPTAATLKEFLALSTPQMAAVILRYKARLIADKKSEATVNRRLAALLSLVKFARRVGATEADPSDHVDIEKVIPYRDTRGITAEQARRLLRQPDRHTLKGCRDYALLLLMLENALRRAEIISLTVEDFDPEAHTLRVFGKGRGTQVERITLSRSGVQAIQDYLRLRGHDEDRTTPLFLNVSSGSYAQPLTADGLYKIVREMATQAGLSSRLSPHRLRHTAITLALDAVGGDLRRVQRLSRHARLDTLRIYDDNRSDLQGEVTNTLSAILSAD